MSKKIALIMAFALCVCAAGSRSKSGRAARGSAENDRHYSEGVTLYARGDLAKALTAFKAAQKRHPGDRTIEAAVARARADLIASAMRRSPPPAEDPTIIETFDAMMTEDLPQLVAFDETIGGADNAQGALGAIQGRVAQLLAEEKIALAHHRRFRKAGELHALARRMPAVVA